jgi:uncharacterized membrane protein
MATSTTPPGPADPGGPARADTGVARAHRILAIAFMVGAVLNFAFAGLGAFKFDAEDSNAFEPHSIVGSLVTVIALVLIILAAIGRKQALQASIVLFVLMIVQTVLGVAGTDAPAIGALHPLNGLLILAVAGMVIAGRPVQFGVGHHGVGA